MVTYTELEEAVRRRASKYSTGYDIQCLWECYRDEEAFLGYSHSVLRDKLFTKIPSKKHLTMAEREKLWEDGTLQKEVGKLLYEVQKSANFRLTGSGVDYSNLKGIISKAYRYKPYDDAVATLEKEKSLWIDFYRIYKEGLETTISDCLMGIEANPMVAFKNFENKMKGLLNNMIEGRA